MTRHAPHLADTPVLGTDRLDLRAPNAEDWPHWRSLMASPRSAFIGGPQDEELAWRSFCHIIGHWVVRGFGLFVICDRASGVPFGMAGPQFPAGWPEPEIGWNLWTDAVEGQGFATEAARAARDFAYGKLGWTTAVSYISADNTRSQALARRLGASFEGDGVVRDTPCQVWRHPDAEVALMGHRDIPVVETKRLILRGPRPEDYPDFKATFASYRSRFMGGPLNAYETWMLYAAEIGHWEIRGFGMWMVHDKATDATVGMAGGWQPAKWPEREIAWIIWPDRAGHGFALEATHAVRRHLYRRMGWEGAVSYIDPKNLDSIRLAERLGAVKDTQAQTIDGSDAVYRHPSPARLADSQLAHGIEMEIAHYADPLFKPKGWAID